MKHLHIPGMADTDEGKRKAYESHEQKRKEKQQTGEKT